MVSKGKRKQRADDSDESPEAFVVATRNTSLPSSRPSRAARAPAPSGPPAVASSTRSRPAAPARRASTPASDASPRKGREWTEESKMAAAGAQFKAAQNRTSMSPAPKPRISASQIFASLLAETKGGEKDGDSSVVAGKFSGQRASSATLGGSPAKKRPPVKPVQKKPSNTTAASTSELKKQSKGKGRASLVEAEASRAVEDSRSTRPAAAPLASTSTRDIEAGNTAGESSIIAPNEAKKKKKKKRDRGPQVEGPTTPKKAQLPSSPNVPLDSREASAAAFDQLLADSVSRLSAGKSISASKRPLVEEPGSTVPAKKRKKKDKGKGREAEADMAIISEQLPELAVAAPAPETTASTSALDALVSISEVPTKKGKKDKSKGREPNFDVPAVAEKVPEATAPDTTASTSISNIVATNSVAPTEKRSKKDKGKGRERNRDLGAALNSERVSEPAALDTPTSASEAVINKGKKRDRGKGRERGPEVTVTSQQVLEAAVPAISNALSATDVSAIVARPSLPPHSLSSAQDPMQEIAGKSVNGASLSRKARKALYTSQLSNQQAVPAPIARLLQPDRGSSSSPNTSMSKKQKNRLRKAQQADLNKSMDRSVIIAAVAETSRTQAPAGTPNGSNKRKRQDKSQSPLPEQIKAVDPTAVVAQTAIAVDGGPHKKRKRQRKDSQIPAITGDLVPHPVVPSILSEAGPSQSCVDTLPSTAADRRQSSPKITAPTNVDDFMDAFLKKRLSTEEILRLAESPATKSATVPSHLDPKATPAAESLPSVVSFSKNASPEFNAKEAKRLRKQEKAERKAAARKAAADAAAASEEVARLERQAQLQKEAEDAAIATAAAVARERVEEEARLEALRAEAALAEKLRLTEEARQREEQETLAAAKAAKARAKAERKHEREAKKARKAAKRAAKAEKAQAEAESVARQLEEKRESMESSAASQVVVARTVDAMADSDIDEDPIRQFSDDEYEAALPPRERLLDEASDAELASFDMREYMFSDTSDWEEDKIYATSLPVVRAPTPPRSSQKRPVSTRRRSGRQDSGVEASTSDEEAGNAMQSQSMTRSLRQRVGGKALTAATVRKDPDASRGRDVAEKETTDSESAAEPPGNAEAVTRVDKMAAKGPSSPARLPEQVSRDGSTPSDQSEQTDVEDDVLPPRGTDTMAAGLQPPDSTQDVPAVVSSQMTSSPTKNKGISSARVEVIVPARKATSALTNATPQAVNSQTSTAVPDTAILDTASLEESQLDVQAEDARQTSGSASGPAATHHQVAANAPTPPLSQSRTKPTVRALFDMLDQDSSSESDDDSGSEQGDDFLEESAEASKSRLKKRSSLAAFAARQNTSSRRQSSSPEVSSDEDEGHEAGPPVQQIAQVGSVQNRGIAISIPPPASPPKFAESPPSAVTQPVSLANTPSAMRPESAPPGHDPSGTASGAPADEQLPASRASSLDSQLRRSADASPVLQDTLDEDKAEQEDTSGDSAEQQDGEFEGSPRLSDAQQPDNIEASASPALNKVHDDDLEEPVEASEKHEPPSAGLPGPVLPEEGSGTGLEEQADGISATINAAAYLNVEQPSNESDDGKGMDGEDNVPDVTPEEEEGEPQAAFPAGENFSNMELIDPEVVPDTPEALDETLSNRQSSPLEQFPESSTAKQEAAVTGLEPLSQPRSVSAVAVPEKEATSEAVSSEVLAEAMPTGLPAISTSDNTEATPEEATPTEATPKEAIPNEATQTSEELASQIFDVAVSPVKPFFSHGIPTLSEISSAPSPVRPTFSSCSPEKPATDEEEREGDSEKEEGAEVEMEVSRPKSASIPPSSPLEQALSALPVSPTVLPSEHTLEEIRELLAQSSEQPPVNSSANSQAPIVQEDTLSRTGSPTADAVTAPSQANDDIEEAISGAEKEIATEQMVPTPSQAPDVTIQPPSARKASRQSRVSMSPIPDLSQTPRRSPRLAPMSPMRRVDESQQSNLYPSLEALQAESQPIFKTKENQDSQETVASQSQVDELATQSEAPSRPRFMDLATSPPPVLTGFDTQSQIDELASQPPAASPTQPLETQPEQAAPSQEAPASSEADDAQDAPQSSLQLNGSISRLQANETDSPMHSPIGSGNISDSAEIQRSLVKPSKKPLFQPESPSTPKPDTSELENSLDSAIAPTQLSQASESAPYEASGPSRERSSSTSSESHPFTLQASPEVEPNSQQTSNGRTVSTRGRAQATFPSSNLRSGSQQQTPVTSIERTESRTHQGSVSVTRVRANPTNMFLSSSRAHLPTRPNAQPQKAMSFGPTPVSAVGGSTARAVASSLTPRNTRTSQAASSAPAKASGPLFGSLSQQFAQRENRTRRTRMSALLVAPPQSQSQTQVQNGRSSSESEDEDDNDEQEQASAPAKTPSSQIPANRRAGSVAKASRKKPSLGNFGR